MRYDDACINAFLKDQLKLFPEKVADNTEEANDFLEDLDAVICANAKEVKEYMLDNLDAYGMTDEEILSAEEVFDIGDGRYLIVEG